MIHSYGYILYCDILGYRSILENNDVDDSAKIIIEHIEKIDEEIKHDLKVAYGFDDNTRNIGKCFLDKRIESINISDSIVVFFDMSNSFDNDREYHTINSLVMLEYIKSFFRKMIEKGLPLRGCLNCGEFFYHNSMFASKIIPETVSQSEKLDFSGIMVTKNCVETIKRNSKNVVFKNQLFSYSLFKALVKIKPYSVEERILINWINDLTWKKEKITSEKLDFLLETSMKSHNRSFSAQALNKLENTIHVYRNILT